MKIVPFRYPRWPPYSHGGHLEILQTTSPPNPYVGLSRNLIGGIRATKIFRIQLSKMAAMTAILKFFTITLNYLLLEYCPLDIVNSDPSHILVPFYNLKMVSEIFLQPCKNVKQTKMTCRSLEPYVWLNYFLSYGSLNIENNSFCDTLVNFTQM